MFLLLKYSNCFLKCVSTKQAKEMYQEPKHYVTARLKITEKRRLYKEDFAEVGEK